MNKKGFTLIELLAVITIMTLIMTLAFPSIRGIINNNTRKKYESYEKTMSEYTKAYFDDYTGTIKLDSLKNAGLNGMDQECVGYVNINENYKAYIKCGDKYITENFSDDYLN